MMTLWQEVDLLQSAGGLRSISDAIEIPFRVFANTNTAVGRLLQYGSESVAAFLSDFALVGWVEVTKPNTLT